MTDQDFAELVAAGEAPGVEFKNARARTDASVIEVIKAALGMANRRDGGLIIIGVEDNGTATGLDAAQAATWANPDHIRQTARPYADPFIYIDSETKTVAAAGLLQGLTFIVLKVKEFEELPALCARGATHHNTVYLVQGACYVRPNHMPATTAVADQTQFRALLELAIEKGVRKFLRTARALGLAVDGAAAPQDADLFRAQAARIDE